MGTSPNTRAVVSQKNKVFGYSLVNGGNGTQFAQLGALSEFGFDESRSIDPYRGVGYGDMVAELVPGVTEPMTLTINKTLLYAANLYQLFGYKGGVSGLVRSLRHHRWPFDIKQEIVFSDVDTVGANGTTNTTTAATGTATGTATTNGTVSVTGGNGLVTVFEGCWMNSYNASFTSDAAIVAENSSVTVTDVHDGTSSYTETMDTGLINKSLRFGAASATTP